MVIAAFCSPWIENFVDFVNNVNYSVFIHYISDDEKRGASMRTLFLFMVLFLLVACGGSSPSSPAPGPGDAQLEKLDVSAGFRILPVGLARPITATGLYSDHSIRDLTDDVTWITSNNQVAVVDNGNEKCFLTGVNPGDVVVSAYLGDMEDSLNITISDAVLTSIEISPDPGSALVGQSLQFTAMGIYSDHSILDITRDALWTSSDLTVAVPDNSPGFSGLFKILQQGAFTITARLGDIEASVEARSSAADLTDVFITPPRFTLEKGLSLALQASGLYSDTSVRDLTREVLWASDDTSIVSVNNSLEGKGVIGAVAQGVVQISAMIGDKTAVCEITVTDSGLISLAIVAPPPSLASGTSFQLEAKGVYNDGSQRDLTGYVFWESSDKGIASASNFEGEKGWLRAHTPGEVSITANFMGQSPSVTITITEATLEYIEIRPLDDHLPSGVKLQYQAMGYFSDGSEQDLTQKAVWQIDDKTIASISNIRGLKGLLYSFAPGELTVSASFGDVIGSTSLTITGESLVSIRFTPDIVVVREDSSMPMLIEGIFSDESVLDLTSEVLWATFNAQVAVAVNTAGQEGTITGIGAGQTYVLAIFGQGGFIVPVVVVRDFLMAPQQVENGIQFRAYGEIGDDQYIDLTENVIWSSDDETVLTISNAEGTQGFADILQAGSCNVTAFYSDDLIVTKGVIITSGK